VFMGVVMKLDDIRVDYLNSISLPDTIPTRLVPAGRTLCPWFSGDDLFITAPRRLTVVPRFIADAVSSYTSIPAGSVAASPPGR
jgi:hypothetical protein